MKFSTITNPKWVNPEQTIIDCIVKFDHIEEPIPFTAVSEGDQEYTHEIFARCVAGEFGAVADYVAPPPLPYGMLRAPEYPPFTEYLDGIVKGDQAQINAYISACKAVKAKYPKP